VIDLRKLFGFESACMELKKFRTNLRNKCTTSSEIRGQGQSGITIMENILKEMFRIYGYSLYGNDYGKKLTSIDPLLDKGKASYDHALKNLKELNKHFNETILQKEKKEFERLFRRNYLIFEEDINKDKVYQFLNDCRDIRGSYFSHDSPQKQITIEDFKKTGIEAMDKLISVLDHWISSHILPNKVRFSHEIKKGDQKSYIFVDENGGEYSLSDKFKDQYYYVFMNDKNIIPIPVYSEIILYGGEEVNNNFNIIVKKQDNTPTIKSVGYVQSYTNKERSFSFINDRDYKIGRSSKNDISLDTVIYDISREHCVIAVKNNKCYLIDKSTYNCTYVNDHKLKLNEKFLLSSGDIIQLGSPPFEKFTFNYS
jgi:hypothetical protein